MNAWGITAEAEARMGNRLSALWSTAYGLFHRSNRPSDSLSLAHSYFPSAIGGACKANSDMPIPALGCICPAGSLGLRCSSRFGSRYLLCRSLRLQPESGIGEINIGSCLGHVGGTVPRSIAGLTKVL